MPARLLNPGVPQAVADNSTWRCCLFYSCLRWLGSISEILRQCVIAVSGMKLPLTDVEVTTWVPLAVELRWLGQAGGVGYLHCTVTTTRNEHLALSCHFSPFFFFFLNICSPDCFLVLLFFVLFFPSSVAFLICGECVFNVSKMLASV